VVGVAFYFLVVVDGFSFVEGAVVLAVVLALHSLFCGRGRGKLQFVFCSM
jgi:hypothetical protein